MNQWLDSLRPQRSQERVGFDLVALVLKREGTQAEFVPPLRSVMALGKIEAGWRPASQPEPADSERCKPDV
jgi:hypothetical protein